MTAHGIAFDVTTVPFEIFVAFVAGDDQNRSDARAAAHRFQHMNSAHDVGRISGDRLSVGRSDQGLRGHVNDDFRRKIAS